MKDIILTILIIILALALCIGIAHILQAQEDHSDEINRTALLEHQLNCDGKCELKSTYATYKYECDKCGQIFEFYNVEVFKDANAYHENH